MTIDLARALSSLMVLTVGLGFACSGGPSFNESTVYIDVQKIPLELRDEYASFTHNCSKCHSLSRALNAPVKEPKHWDLYVARMMRTAGSSISPHEAPVILRFLHWYTASYDSASALPGEEAPVAPSESPEPFPAASAPPVEQQAPDVAPKSDPPPEPAAVDQGPPASEEASDVTQTTAGEGK